MIRRLLAALLAWLATEPPRGTGERMTHREWQPGYYRGGRYVRGHWRHR